jgi:hypothetical protein
MVTVLHSDDGLTTPTITSFVIGTAFTAPELALPNECIVLGGAIDGVGDLRAGDEVIWDHSGFRHTNHFIKASSHTAIVGADGQWQIQVVETASIPLAPWRVVVRRAGQIYGERFINITVPDQATANATDVLGQPV